MQYFVQWYNLELQLLGNEFSIAEDKQKMEDVYIIDILMSQVLQLIIREHFN